jgi:hypothetical protein
MAWAKKPQICVRLKRVVLTQKINMGIQARATGGRSYRVYGVH